MPEVTGPDRAKTPYQLRVARVLERVGLDRRAFRLYESRLANATSALPDVGHDGLPIPPAHLQVLVAGAAVASFGMDGAAQTIRELLSRNDYLIEDRRSILDFGIGCGRIARHWAELSGPELHGCDYNSTLTAWCASNLPFVAVATNELEPPLGYEDDAFDLVYALSVFTHLREDLQFAWIDELARVLEPGGLLLFTVHGAATTDRLDGPELGRFDDGELVERFSGSSGSNLCSVFHPESWVRKRLLRDFTVVDVIRGDAPGMGSHDVYLARRSGEVPS